MSVGAREICPLRPTLRRRWRGYYCLIELLFTTTTILRRKTKRFTQKGRQVIVCYSCFVW